MMRKKLGWRRRGGSSPVTNLNGLVTSSSPFSLSDMLVDEGGGMAQRMYEQQVGVRGEACSDERQAVVVVVVVDGLPPKTALGPRRTISSAISEHAPPLANGRPPPSCVFL